MDIQTEKGLKEALACLEEGNPAKAQKIISALFETALECPELMYTTLCCTFWIPTIASLNEAESSYERGEVLLTEWKSFLTYIDKQKGEYKPAFFATQKGVFSLALENYSKLMDNPVPAQKSEIYRKAGMCYKKLGEFDNACVCLTEANKIQPNQASILAELADCFSLCGNDRNAKVLFREAFFLSPEKIDLDFLDSGLIRSLIEMLEPKQYSKRVLSEWIPVYGVLWGIFNIKRELSSQEIGKLKQDIYSLEIEMKNPSCDSEVLVPRLLKYYFWLIDQYVMTNNMNTQINEILLKIKITDLSIYELYVK